MAAHRFWRLYIDSVGNTDRHCHNAGRVEFRETLTGTDLCRANGGTPLANNGDYGSPALAYDSDDTTLWHDGCQLPTAYIGWDFGAGNAYEVNAVEYRARGNGYGNQDSPVTGRVQSSDDGVTWNDEWALPTQPQWADWEYRLWGRPVVRADDGGHRYWRALVTTGSGQGYNGLSQMLFSRDAGMTTESVYGAPMGPNNLQSSDYYYTGVTTILFPVDTYQIQWDSGANPQWVGYDFGAGNAVKINAITVGPSRDNPNRTPMAFRLQYSDDGVAWTNATPDAFAAQPWTAGQAQTLVVPPPAGSSATQASEARIFTVAKLRTSDIFVSEARTLGLYRYFSQGERVSSAKVIAPVKRHSKIDVSEVQTLAVVKGRIADPRVRAWTFTLDGHDFYVLRLGDAATLVYDTSSKQWVQWDTPAHGAWRPLIGTTWTGAHKLAATYGTNIVAGDDEYGILWFLDPTRPFDDDPYTGAPQAFTRVVTGQVLATGRQQLPCYAVFVDGDNYGLTAPTILPYVRLDTSDDQGRTFDLHDTLTASGDNPQPDTWYSLGQFGSPGRIFRLTDNGVYTRIDAMEMNDDAG